MPEYALDPYLVNFNGLHELLGESLYQKARQHLKLLSAEPISKGAQSMTYDEMIAVIQAAKDGKDIEYRYPHQPNDWRLVELNKDVFSFGKFEYRIKPEPPKPKEIWVNEYKTADKLLAYETEREAKTGGNSEILRKAVLYREVNEEADKAVLDALRLMGDCNFKAISVEDIIKKAAKALAMLGVS